MSCLLCCFKTTSPKIQPTAAPTNPAGGGQPVQALPSTIPAVLQPQHADTPRPLATDRPITPAVGSRAEAAAQKTKRTMHRTMESQQVLLDTVRGLDKIMAEQDAVARTFTVGGPKAPKKGPAVPLSSQQSYIAAKLDAFDAAGTQ